MIPAEAYRNTRIRGKGKTIMYFKNNHLKVFFGVFLLAAALAAPPAYAQQKTAALSEKIVEDFIVKTSEITSGQAGSMNPESIEKYLETHLHKDAHFKSTMVYNVPGYPAQKNAMSLNKADFIHSVKEGAGAITGYENEIAIEKIEISGNRKNATVTTRSHETGTMAIDDGMGGTQEVPISGASQCTQILKLNKQNILQMYNAVCVTEIKFED